MGVATEDVLRVASGGIGGLGSLEALGYSTGTKLAERLRAAQVTCSPLPSGPDCGVSTGKGQGLGKG